MRLLSAVLALALVTLAASSVRADLACAPAPAAGCRAPFTPHKSSLAFKQTGHTDPDDIYTWRWQAGSATTLADFGDPLATTDYVLCIYDQSERPQPVVGNLAPAATGWKALATGYKRYYRPTRSLRQLVLHAGADGKAKILAHGDSDTIATLLPFVPPVVVQLQSGTGACWETNLATPKRDDERRFDGKD
jgi:hypothetical protein